MQVPKLVDFMDSYILLVSGSLGAFLPPGLASTHFRAKIITRYVRRMKSDNPFET